ncbi:MAG: hypothetical protein QXF28_08270 [Nitrososphaerota archaeon]
MTIPLAKKMKKRIHKVIAMGQDLLVLTIYDNFPDAGSMMVQLSGVAMEVIGSQKT